MAPHCPNTHIHTLLTTTLAFSPHSWDDLKRAVDGCFGFASEDHRPTQLYGQIGQWDVSQVNDMSTMFYDIDTFNDNLSKWDVSRVTEMRMMFAHARKFDQDLSKWDVSRVRRMGTMFRDAASFNHDLSNWDVSRVTEMLMMFNLAKSFNQDLSEWDVSRVTDMRGMFANANSFNQTLCGTEWMNSDALNVEMFTNSLGSISDTVCGT